MNCSLLEPVTNKIIIIWGSEFKEMFGNHFNKLNNYIKLWWIHFLCFFIVNLVLEANYRTSIIALLPWNADLGIDFCLPAGASDIISNRCWNLRWWYGYGTMLWNIESRWNWTRGKCGIHLRMFLQYLRCLSQNLWKMNFDKLKIWSLSKKKKKNQTSKLKKLQNFILLACKLESTA